MFLFQCRGQGTHHTLPSKQSRQLAQDKGAPSLKQAAADRAAKPAERRGSTHHIWGGGILFFWLSVDASLPDQVLVVSTPPLQGEAQTDGLVLVHTAAEQACATSSSASVAAFSACMTHHSTLKRPHSQHCPYCVTTSATQWPPHLSSSCSMRCLKCSSSHAMDACTSTSKVASDPRQERSLLPVAILR